MGKTKTAFVSELIEEKKEKPKESPQKIHIAGLKGGQRVKIVEAQMPPAEEIKKEGAEKLTEAKAAGKQKKERIRSKKYQEAKAKVDNTKTYALPAAVKLVKETSYSKFDGSIELHLLLKKSGINTNVTLPHSAGKEKKIEVATDETINKLSRGKIDFDVLLATPEMMPKLVPYARILGPKGLMPNPKNGSLIKSINDADKFSSKTLNLKTEKEAPLIHTTVGKVSQEDKELIENIEAVLTTLGGTKQVIKAYAKATMGPAVKLALS
jgi:large subunit ribosomal protein L1